MGASRTYVALLRGINVGGHQQVSMAELRGLLGQLGFADVRSLLQSGNLVFRAGARAIAPLERLLEAETREQLGIETGFFVRTAEEWDTIVAGNVYPEEAQRDPGHLLVFFLREAPAPRNVDALREAIKGREVVRAEGRELYAVYPDGMGRSRLTIDIIESKLGTRGTARNWNTVLKISALVKT